MPTVNETHKFASQRLQFSGELRDLVDHSGRLPNHDQGNADALLAGSGAAGRRDLALRIET
jgi:hypothetical protein